jgi:glycosyltransferase involved in cell wall biosynthesis
MKLSIIIPVYNVEQYIEKCVRSLLDQDLPSNDYEIIVVNDGSPDNSRDVVLKLATQFNNIVFIEQENKGVSLARNAAIDLATGQYLLFIDPDDYVVANSLLGVWQAAKEARAEVVFLGYKFLNADNSVRKEIVFPGEQGNVYTGIKAYQISRGDGTTDPDRSWAILYNRDFINRNKLRNIAGVPYLEDGEFIARVLCLAERCIFKSGIFYIRTTRTGSATNSGLFYSDKAIKGFIKAGASLFKFQQSHLITLDQKEFLNQPICKFVLLAVNSSLQNKGEIKLANVMTELKILCLNKCALKGCNKYYRRDGFIFNFSPKVYSIYRPIWAIIDNIYFRLLKIHP